MKIRYAVVALVALLVLPAAKAQTGSSAAKNAAPDAAAPSKLGVINVQVAITSTSEGKQASAELQSQFAPRQTELDNLRKQVEDIQTRLRTGASTLSDEEKQRLAREGDQLTRSFQRKQQDLQDDGNEAQREVVDRIGRKMLDVVDKYSRENGLAVVIDTSSQNTPVVYAANQVDITQDIIRLYDQAYPVKNTPAQKPAAQRPPAAKPPQPQQPPQSQPKP
jgi:outer membrane protein